MASMLKAKKPPIGISDFRKLREGNYHYVDKSLLIQELLDSPAEILLLPRPRRFGKTLNLSLLRYFFENPPGEAEPANAELFTGLAVSQLSECLAYQGAYPVIFLTFKDIKERCFKDCFRQVQSVLADEYDRHRSVIETSLDKNKRMEMEKILAKEANRTDTERSLLKLTEYLHRATGKKVMLLIDEYDTPIHSAYANNYYEDAIHLIRNLLGAALKDNPHIEKGVLTGILRVARESLFSGLNNLAVHTVLRKPFSDKFGFTEDETEQLLVDCGRSSNLDVVREWYNGYRFGETVIYNPWSILNYCANPGEAPTPYWVNTSSNDLIRDLIVNGDPDLHGELERLLNNQTVRSRLNEHIVLRDIEQSRETVMSFMVHCGYLKPMSKTREGDEDFYELTPPNREVHLFFRNTISGWLNRTIGDRRLERMLTALTTGDVDTFGELFQELVLGVFSFHDLPKRRGEQAYHAFVLGLLVNLGRRYEVRSNRESGYGRYDALLIPKNPDDLGIVFEFKEFRKGKDDTALTAMDAALLQIREKDYAAELRAGGAKRILGIGVVFEGKRVLVRETELAGVAG